MAGEFAALLDSDVPVPGVTAGPLRPEVAAVAVPSTIDGRNMDGQDFELSVGWGYFGSGLAVMPGQGGIQERLYNLKERAVLGDDVTVLGRNHLRHLSERPCILEKRPRCRLELQTRWLPGAQEVAVLQGEQGLGQGTSA